MGGVQVGWVRVRNGEVSAQSMGGWEKTSVPTFSYIFLKKLTEGAVMTDTRSLFQYFTTLTENADPLLRRRLTPWRGALLDHVEREEGKTSSDQYPKGS